MDEPPICPGCDEPVDLKSGLPIVIRGAWMETDGNWDLLNAYHGFDCLRAARSSVVDLTSSPAITSICRARNNFLQFMNGGTFCLN